MRGDIYQLKASRSAQGHEQQEQEQGIRYGVVVQSDHLLLSTVPVVPTSTSCSPASFRPVIDIDGVTTRALVEQTAAVDVQTRLGRFVGRLDPAEMQAVDQALQTVLGLD